MHHWVEYPAIPRAIRTQIWNPIFQEKQPFV